MNPCILDQYFGLWPSLNCCINSKTADSEHPLHSCFSPVSMADTTRCSDHAKRFISWPPDFCSCFLNIQILKSKQWGCIRCFRYPGCTVTYCTSLGIDYWVMLGNHISFTAHSDLLYAVRSLMHLGLHAALWRIRLLHSYCGFLLRANILLSASLSILSNCQGFHTDYQRLFAERRFKQGGALTTQNLLYWDFIMHTIGWVKQYISSTDICLIECEMVRTQRYN